MAIVFDKSGSAVGSGNNAAVSLAATTSQSVAIIFVNRDPGDSFSSLTVNGSSSGVTQVGGEVTPTGGRTVRTYYLVNPPTSSVSYSFTTTGADGTPQIYVDILSGVSQSAPTWNKGKTLCVPCHKMTENFGGRSSRKTLVASAQEA